MRRFTVAAVLAILVIPGLVYAGPARVRGLAAGDARLVPDDDSNIGIFPGTIHQHHRIALHNIDHNGLPSDPDLLTPLGLIDAETWGEATWEMWGGTVGWAVGRPTRATLHQRLYTFLLDDAGEDVPPPARTMIDLAWGTEQWGFVVDLGTSSFEVPSGTSTETWRNVALDAVFGMNMNGIELAFNGSLSTLGALDGKDPDDNAIVAGDEQNANMIALGADARAELGLPFFNHLVASGQFMKDVKVSNEPQDDAPTSISLDLTISRYMMAGGEHPGGAADDFTYLLALGTGIFSADPGVGDDPATNSVDEEVPRATAIMFPSATAGAEYDLTDWLAIRGSVARASFFVFQKDNNSSFTSETVTTVGATGHWGKFSLEAVLNNNLFEDGPNFIGGKAPGISNFISGIYTF